MKPAPYLFAICLLFSTVYSAAQGGNQTACGTSTSATLKAQVGAELNSQQLLPAKPGLVFVIYTSGMLNGSFTHGDDRDTAGRQYNYERERLFGGNKELKALSRKKPPLNEQEYDQMSQLSLAIVDESLEAASNWVSKHPDRAWQNDQNSGRCSRLLVY